MGKPKSDFCPLGYEPCKEHLCRWYVREYSPEKKKVMGACQLDSVARQIVPDQKGGA